MPVLVKSLFFETVNAAGVLQVPMIISIWDDEYGISVHAKHQTTKENISEILSGFQRTENESGYEILTVKGWDYVSLIDTYKKQGEIARNEHVPVIIHVQELTQPQGHSTSGSHERYKSPERLQWEKDHDCISKMRAWIIENNISDDAYLTDLEKNCKIAVRQGKNRAWQAYLAPIEKEKEDVLVLLGSLADQSKNKAFINNLIKGLKDNSEPVRKDVISAARKGLRYTINENSKAKETLRAWINTYFENIQPKYSSHFIQ